MREIPAQPDQVVHSGTTIGMPDGPPEYHPEFGCWVGTFTHSRPDLDDILFKKTPSLMYHVPRPFRGPYRPDQLPNFDIHDEGKYRTGLGGHVMCNKEIAKRIGHENDPRCKRKAANRSGFCEAHGGRLHPLDKTDANINHKDPMDMSRLELLEAGYIGVEDLTDNELMNGVNVKGKHVRFSKEIYEKITNRQFDRAQEMLREGLLPAIQALNHIAQGTAYEPADRIKAAAYIIDRVMGKTPNVVVSATAKEPWEQLVAGVSTISREESRARREANTVDAEVVPDETVPETNSESSDDFTSSESVPLDVQESDYREYIADRNREVLEGVEAVADIKAATQKRYKMRASGRSSVEDGPIYLGSEDARSAANVTIGQPGDDAVS